MQGWITMESDIKHHVKALKHIKTLVSYYVELIKKNNVDLFSWTSHVPFFICYLPCSVSTITVILL